MSIEPDGRPQADSPDAGARAKDGPEDRLREPSPAPASLLRPAEPLRPAESLQSAEPLQSGEPLQPAAQLQPAAGPPPVADGIERHLDPRSVTLGRLRGGITCLVLSFPLLIVAVVSALASGSAIGALFRLGGWVAFVALLALWAHRWPEISHRHRSYRLDADGIEIKHGVFWRTVVNVPRSRVQHTDVAQGPLERRFSLGRLVIYTAGSAYARVALEGLEHSIALRIRDYLLPGGTSDAL